MYLYVYLSIYPKHTILTDFPMVSAVVGSCSPVSMRSSVVSYLYLYEAYSIYHPIRNVPS